MRIEPQRHGVGLAFGAVRCDAEKMKNPGVGLYIHIPFCASRCGYCTFVSSLYSTEKADAYLNALEAELRARGIFDSAETPETAFIGGGTPSVLSPRQLERLLSFLPRSGGEFTCEVNPDSCTREKLEILRGCGVNRLSFGVQTFDKAGLRLLRRRHTAAQAAAAAELAASLGFASVNIDLINGWPGQTEDCVRRDAATAAALGARHVSNYNVILEPSASEYAAYCALIGGESADEETGARHWRAAEEVLEGLGFEHYEVSSFAKSGHRCAHNESTWRGGEYWGIGLGACSHIGGVRWGNISDFDEYCARSGEAGGVTEYTEKLSPEAKARECAVFWLRLFKGIDTAAFAERTGMDFYALYSGVLPGLLESGALVREGGRVRVGKAHRILLDSVLEELV